MRMRLRLSLLTALLGILSTGSAHAEVRLSRVFGDHMVLQRDQPVPIWGWAEPGERVTVAFAGQEQSTQAGPDGAWRVRLEPLTTNREPQTLTVQGSHRVTIRDVLVGDVWLCSGQSNMAFGLGAVSTPEELRQFDCPTIRYRGYFECFAGDPRPDLEPAPWSALTPASAGGCTAVGAYFARRVQREVDVPIGLLECTVGGTEIECWLPPQAFRDYPELAPIGQELQRAVAAWRESLPAQLDAFERWLKEARQALATGTATLPPRPPLPAHPNEDRNHWVRIQSLYNGMVHPMVPIALKGVLWYQGENNNGQDQAYLVKQRALIETWRNLWGREFPFYYVQLASWQKPLDDPSGGDRNWNFTRMGQLRSLAVPRTGMAVTIDVGDADDIHPRNKRAVGERLALWALARDYGQTDLVCSGPLYQGMTIEGDRIRVAFAPFSVGSGLAVSAPAGTPETPPALKQFAIAGADRRWHWAEARIDGDRVVVWSPQVPHPVAVRYAFQMNPAGANLVNREGLPASPFRTDDW